MKNFTTRYLLKIPSAPGNPLEWQSYISAGSDNMARLLALKYLKATSWIGASSEILLFSLESDQLIATFKPETSLAMTVEFNSALDASLED